MSKLLFGLLFTFNLFAENQYYISLNSEITSTFIAKFCLFIGLILLFTITVGKILKYIFKIPVIAGQIISGILLGPSVLNIASWRFFSKNLNLGSDLTQIFINSSDLFIFVILVISSAFTVSYLLWLAGYETNVYEMIKVGPAATLAGIFGVLVPIVLTPIALIMFGIFISLGFGCSLITAVGVGIIFSATSVSIPVAMLVSQRKMYLRSSKATLGAAIIDDILAVVLLSFFLVALQSGFFSGCQILKMELHTGSLFASVIKILITFIAFFVAGLTVIPIIMRWCNKNRLISLIAPLAFCFMLFYFSFSELFGGLAGITGAYFAGIFQRRVDFHNYSEEIITPFVNSIFLPLFLASVGLQVDITSLSRGDWLVVSILFFVAVFSKIFGVYIATLISNLLFEVEKWTFFESYIFGSSMVARGEVGLVIATLLKNIGVIDTSLYIVAVVVIILTTICTPILLSIGFSLEKKPPDSDYKILKLGTFDTIGTDNMFEVIVDTLEKSKHAGTYIKLSDGHIVVDFQKDKIDIIYSPKEGIILRGNQEPLNNMINLIYSELSSDFSRLKKAVETLH